MDFSKVWDSSHLMFEGQRPDVAFTGTREGMTEPQKATFSRLIEYLTPSSLHHGDCVGADENAHDIVKSLMRSHCLIHIHPGPGAYYRAGCTGDMTYPVLPFLERNHQMVDITDITIATPKEPEPVLRSGTWSTIRYSMSNMKPTVIIKPDGSAVLMDSGKEVKL